MTGRSGWRSFIWGRSSRPLWPGSARSSSTRSKLSWSIIRSPSSPSAAILAVYPSSLSSASSDSRMAISSSTTRMRVWLSTAPESPAGADADGFNSVSTSGMNTCPQQGKLKVEGCAGADGALDMYLAGVLLDDAVGDGKPQAGTAAVASAGYVFGGEKRIVDALQVFGRDPGAGVVDQRGNVFVLPVEQRGQAQAAASRHGFLGVQQQVEKYLLQLAGVAVDGRQFLCQFQINDNLSGLELVIEQGERVA